MSKEVAPFTTYNDEIKFINRALGKLETEIQLLISRKTQYLRRLNQIRDTTRFLPSETLSIIFEQACSDLESGLFPLVLGGVCSRWREAAWSCPKLWISISIKAIVSSMSQVSSHCVDLLRLYFTNVAGLSVNVQFSSTRVLPKLHVPLHDLLLLLFRDYPQKLRSLELGLVTSEWWRQICDCIQPELLTNLTMIHLGRLSNVHFNESTSPFVAAPKLTNISAYSDIGIVAYP